MIRFALPALDDAGTDTTRVHTWDETRPTCCCRRGSNRVRRRECNPHVRAVCVVVFHDAKLGYLWNATLAAPALTHKTRLMHAGQDVCNDLGRGTKATEAMASLRNHYALTAQQMVSVTHAAVGFLCPVYRYLIQPTG